MSGTPVAGAAAAVGVAAGTSVGRAGTPVAVAAATVGVTAGASVGEADIAVGGALVGISVSVTSPPQPATTIMPNSTRMRDKKLHLEFHITFFTGMVQPLP